MKIVVTGSTGFIGSCLFRSLSRKGKSVTAFSIDHPPPEQRECHIQGDVRDFGAVNQAVKGADLVYHLASSIALTKEKHKHLMDVNVNGVRTVIEACLEQGVKRLVYVSSIHAFDQKPRKQVLNESRSYVPADKLLVYDRSKALAEMVVKDAINRGLDAVIVNPSGVIGPYDPGTSHMGHVLCRMFQGRMPVLVQGGFNWVDVRDVVEGIQSAAEHGRTGENYILGGHWSSIGKLARMANKIRGSRQFPIIVPAAVAKMAAPFAVRWNQRLKKPCYFTPYSIEALKANPRVDYKKAKSELHYQSRPLESTLKDTYEWMVENGHV